MGLGWRGIASAAAAAALLAPPAFADFPADPPNDPLFDNSPLPGATSEQWDLQAGTGIGAAQAWALATGAGELIAAIDLGFEAGHPDLAGKELPGLGWDYYARDGDPASDTGADHGTNVAGVLAAHTNNGLGIAGGAPDARLIYLRTADDILHQGQRLAQAIVHAVDRGAGSISMSLGADAFPSSLRRAAAYALRRGTVIAVASGNEFHFHHHQPQMLDEVLAVGGVNPDTATLAAQNEGLAIAGLNFRTRAQYSDFGPHLDLVAPTQVPTTHVRGGYRKTWSGTSAAAPHVAAAVALVRSRAAALGIRLSAGEVIQLLRMTATDLADPLAGEHPGWDLKTGWGRVDAAAAVRRVGVDTIPPDANITAPEWYEPVAASQPEIAVRGFARGRSPVTWVLEAGAGEDPRSWRTLARGTRTGSLRSPSLLAQVPRSALPAGGVTLRLRATDERGNVGEDRAYFRLLADPGLKAGFPLRLGTSGESSPQLADLDGDRAQEIVLALSDGSIAVRDGRTGRVRPGWPRRADHVAMSAPAASRIGAVRAGFLATPAVGDIDGDGAADVVAASLDGRVHAWSARGGPLDGFPVAIGIDRPAENGRLDAAIYSSPALGDLDGDGRLDVVAAAADQQVYAWDGRGRPLPGWPVLARDGKDGAVAKILASPAIGDIDGDGKPDVIAATGEAYGATPSTSGRIHAFDAQGRPKPGWPVKPAALAADSIPLAGEGVPGSPLLADLDGDGDDEVFTTGAFTGQPAAYDGDGSAIRGRIPGRASHIDTAGRGPLASSSAPAVISLGANGALAQTRAGGPLRFFGGAVDVRLAAAQLAPAQQVEFDHVMGGWDAASGGWLPGFPRRMEGWQIISGPAVADVDGDGSAEVLAGGSGNVLHAFREDGSEPSGWPKQTEGWLLAAPAAGDADGDGLLEIVAVTRDGWLFAWDTPTQAGPGAAPWPVFRGGPRNTGAYRPAG